MIFRSANAIARIERARAWLAARAPAEEVLVVAASADAANELLRERAVARGAAFGWHRATLGRLAAELARGRLAAAGLVPAGALACEAIVARAVHGLAADDRLGRYAALAATPGFARASWRTLAELRLGAVDPASLEIEELRTIATAVADELARAGLADRARVLEVAAEAARGTDHALLGKPLLLLDLPLRSARERQLIAAVAARAGDVLATLPAGDAQSEIHLAAALGVVAQDIVDEATPPGAQPVRALHRLQQHLFAEPLPEPCALDETVTVLSAPGESRECVEIARRILQHASRGVPFDHMAILLRAPAEYRAHLEEALGRARIPAHFARGIVRPDPAGRAFLALLRCALEGLSARRFAEYLSLGEVPDATAAGLPPTAPSSGERWVAADEEMVPRAVSEMLEASADAADATAEVTAEVTADTDVAARAPVDGCVTMLDGDHPGTPGTAVTAGTLRAPRRWERLLVDAAVLGGRERWERRLAGLRHELELDLAELEDPSDAHGELLRRSIADLAALRTYALPLLDELAALPAAADWGAWLERLGVLASRALRHPDRVLAVLAELTPMAGVGPIDLAEVSRVLARRLLELTLPPPRTRHGRVFVAPVEAARGLAFDVVFVPGLAEKLFPRKIAEEPILLDHARQALGQGLAVNADRVAEERAALRLAAGAAAERIVLSWPRLDLEQARPRVPSFYVLEALRAAEGQLPRHDELAKRAELVSVTRIGWPAPRARELAIDEAEYDLALLEPLLELDPRATVGTARYLLGANPHLARALRCRWQRWRRRWTGADGLLEPSATAREVLARHTLQARSYSPTALQHFATCPYKFYLQAIWRLAPREEAVAIEELNPLQRGSLVHEVQFELFTRLAAAKLLPVDEHNLDAARALLDEALNAVAARHHDDLAPAIERVWQDGILGVRADLREWLRRASEDRSGFVPWRFELSFGLAQRRPRDPHSVLRAVALDCGIALRGSIDLIERHGDELRVTDHKTGKARVEPDALIAGGESLQPVLYALAAEKMFADARVVAGRLYYCTADGGFEEREVPLDADARQAAATLAEIVGGALQKGFLPALPKQGACHWCDYALVCGPYEEQRSGRKPKSEVEDIERLRRLP